MREVGDKVNGLLRFLWILEFPNVDMDWSGGLVLLSYEGIVGLLEI